MTSAVKTDNKAPDQLIYARQLISLKILFHVSAKPINYIGSYLNTVVIFSC